MKFIVFLSEYIKDSSYYIVALNKPATGEVNMKNIFSRVFSNLTAAFIPFAGVVFALAISSCSGISESETGKVSFSISRELIQAVSDVSASRTADARASTEESSSENEGKYTIAISLKGDFVKTESKEYPVETWNNLTGDSFTFDDIPVESNVYVTASITYYAPNEKLEPVNKWKILSGSSERVKIQQGDNMIELKTHLLARVIMQMSPQLANPTSVEVYALPKDSDLASKIIALINSGVAENATGIYWQLKESQRIASYPSLETTTFTDSYDLKKDSENYFFSLCKNDSGAFNFGYHEQLSPVTIEITKLNISNLEEGANKVELKLDEITPEGQQSAAYFPSDYNRNDVIAWYACDSTDSESTSGGTTKKIIAVYLFKDGKFLNTKYRVKNGVVTREIEAEGDYTLEGTCSNGTLSASFEGGESGKVTMTFEIAGGVFTKSGEEEEIFYRQYIDIPTEPDTPDDPSQHSPMEFSITLNTRSVPTEDLYQVTIYAVNADGYARVSKIPDVSIDTDKAKLLVETLENEDCAKYLGCYQPQNMTVSSDGSSIVITDSYTSYGAMQANATTAIVALVQYGSDSTDFKAFTVGVSDSFTTSTSSTNTVSMNMDSMAVPVKVNFFVGKNPNLLSSTVIVSDTWVANLETIAADSSILSDKLAAFIRENGYENATIPTSGSYSYNGIPCFGVQVEKTGNTYTGTCEKNGTTYNITLSVYEKDSSSGIYSVTNDLNSLLISAGTYTVSNNVVTVLETDYRSDYSSSNATLYGAYGAAEQSFNTTDSTFTLTSGSTDSDTVTFTFGN